MTDMHRHNWTHHSMGRPVLRFPFFMLIFVAAAGMALAQSEPKPSGAPKPAAAAQAPKVIALGFHADWCSKCKALEPNLKEVMQDAATQQVLFVKLDQTDRDSRQAEYMVAALGVADLWKEQGGKTGFVLLIEPSTHKVVQTLTHEQTPEQMSAALQQAVRSAPAPKSATGKEHPEHPKSKKPDHPEHPK